MRLFVQLIHSSCLLLYGHACQCWWCFFLQNSTSSTDIDDENSSKVTDSELQRVRSLSLSLSLSLSHTHTHIHILSYTYSHSLKHTHTHQQWWPNPYPLSWKPARNPLWVGVGTRLKTNKLSALFLVTSAPPRPGWRVLSILFLFTENSTFHWGAEQIALRVGVIVAILVAIVGMIKLTLIVHSRCASKDDLYSHVDSIWPHTARAIPRTGSYAMYIVGKSFCRTITYATT